MVRVRSRNNVDGAWRLLRTDAAPGAWNMAVDEAILEAHRRGLVPPTIRFYGWQPPCLSLGRFQPAADTPWRCCRELGIDLVRRPTGGKAVLHDQELTYSIVVREDHPAAAGSIPESSRKISAGLVEGLRLLGLAVQQQPRTRLSGHSRSAACFMVPSDYEITVGGRKLVGSAQVRQGDVLLQHGSVLLELDQGKMGALFGDGDLLGARTQTVNIALGRDVPLEEVAEALRRGFASALGMHLQAGSLTETEQALADRLFEEKYACPSWTFAK